MGFLKGSASFVRFGVEGQLPEDALDFIAERIKGYAFRDIDDSYDEYSIGWVSVVNMFDASFAFASYAVGDNIVLTLRVDERKVSPAVLKKMVQKEEERVRLEKQMPKLSRGMKVEIRERIKSELTKKALPVPAIYDLYWNLSDNTVFFFTTNKKMHAVLEDFFKEVFGLTLRQRIPYLIGLSLLDNQAAARLDQITPQLFI
ncbi:MAG TPA: DNA recombination-dependent growth factor C [Desulfobulbaceae bacterium]|nr:DNA recombination-dependent growth factor C [Desulfobulbaceae bacterium]